MRCRTCGATAVINMRAHKLSLCAAHFQAWCVKQTSRSIHKYRMFTPDERVLVAVSGGKDSLALWHILLQLGYQADGLYIDLGIDGGFDYSRRSREYVQVFHAQHPETRLHIINIPGLYGESVSGAARHKKRESRVCAVCGLIKRHEMNRIALQENYHVLATGHNLDDETAVLFGNVLHWQVGYLQRQHPVLPADDNGLSRKVKPLCRLYERETAAFAITSGIDYIVEECPYAQGATSIAHKETLTRMEHHAPGTKMHFYTKFLQAKSEGLICSSPDEKPTLQACPVCGQPTSAEGLCAFCRLWETEPAAERE
ncbi:MAG: ATP-binding protein [Anaerolineae bacterium]|nr:ATP-binding protein [Anaerolineae bacterium]